jgi:hypothetical protein
VLLTEAKVNCALTSSGSMKGIVKNPGEKKAQCFAVKPSSTLLAKVTKLAKELSGADWFSFQFSV